MKRKLGNFAESQGIEILTQNRENSNGGFNS